MPKWPWFFCPDLKPRFKLFERLICGLCGPVQDKDCLLQRFPKPDRQWSCQSQSRTIFQIRNPNCHLPYMLDSKPTIGTTNCSQVYWHNNGISFFCFSAGSPVQFVQRDKLLSLTVPRGICAWWMQMWCEFKICCLSKQSPLLIKLFNSSW